MTEYTITIEGYESGLTPSAVEDVVSDMFGNTTTNVTVTESQSASETSVEE